MTFHGELLSCVLKVGRGGAVVDNMCSQGMYGNINMQYGLTDSLFYDIGLNEYAFHPTSGARLIGVEIPNGMNWKKWFARQQNYSQMSSISDGTAPSFKTRL